ncbi:MAG TPA: polyamine ABC transporter substrate-binding protein, partial [Stellaceae bacterium]|nr:polyamine ABC transporter substrate-binding protein [Stellaceae bacterium]
ADYIGRNTIAEFEKATGIKVTYDTFDSDPELEAKLMAGGTSYDIVTTSTNYFGRQIKAGVYQPLDKSMLPNWDNLDPRILGIEAEDDPGNAHAMPYLHGTNGFAYNVDMIKARMPDAPVDSLDMLFKPEIVSKFADCGVTLLDSPEDVLQMALSYLHLDPNSTKADDYKQVEDLILKVRPYIRAFDTEQYMNALPNKEVCIAMSWSADYETARARAKAAGFDVNLAFTVPKEGANEWYDGFLIPAGAPHPEAAHKFLNFMLDPKVIAEITNEIHYANDNAASRQYVDPSLLNDPAIYPGPEIEKRLYHAREVTAATERLRTRTWTKIKTGV